MRRFDAYEIQRTREWTDEGDLIRETLGGEAEEGRSAPAIPCRSFWTLYGRIGAQAVAIADVETEDLAGDLLRNATGSLRRPGAISFIAPNVEQGALVPGREDAVCAVIISDDDIVQATLDEDDAGNSVGITRELAREYLVEHGRDVESAFTASWFDNLQDIQSLRDFAMQHRAVLQDE